MRALSSIIIVYLICQISFGQERLITGKVIDQNAHEFPGVLIIYNSKVLDTTELDGSFKFIAKTEIKKIEVAFLGCQTEFINISENCNYVEVVLLEDWIFDFVSAKAAERKKKRYKKKLLPKVIAEAYEKKLFDKNKSCR